MANCARYKTKFIPFNSLFFINPYIKRNTNQANVSQSKYFKILLSNINDNWNVISKTNEIINRYTKFFNIFDFLIKSP